MEHELNIGAVQRLLETYVAPLVWSENGDPVQRAGSWVRRISAWWHKPDFPALAFAEMAREGLRGLAGCDRDVMRALEAAHQFYNLGQQDGRRSCAGDGPVPCSCS